MCRDPNLRLKRGVGQRAAFCKSSLAWNACQVDGELPTLTAQNLDPNRIGAIGFRAPELFYGLQPKDTKSDLWSLGVVVMNLGGVSWPRLPSGDSDLQASYVHCIFSRLGQPPVAVAALFKKDGSRWSCPSATPVPQGLVPDPWPRSANLGSAGDDLIRKLVQWDSGERPTAYDVSEHPFCVPCQFEPSGWFLECPWHESGQVCPPSLEGVGDLRKLTPATKDQASDLKGHRHHACLRVARLGADTLRWLQGDPAFKGNDIMGSIGAAALDDKKEKTENNARGKVVKRLSGFFAGSGVVQNGVASVKPANVVGNAKGVSVNDFTLDTPLPIKRVSAFLEAFLVKNRHQLSFIHSRLKHVFLQKKPGEDDKQHGNFTRFLDLWTWLLRAAEIHVTEPFWSPAGAQDSACAPGSRKEFLHEARHNDGSSSILHASLTLFGRRDVHLEQSHEKPDLKKPRAFKAEELHDFVVVNEPGTFYCGQVTGLTHQVHHRSAMTGELWRERYSVTVQFRTTLFYNRLERQMKFVTCDPPKLWETFCEQFPRLWSEADLVLPTLAECEIQLGLIAQAETDGERQLPCRSSAMSSSSLGAGAGSAGRSSEKRARFAA